MQGTIPHISATLGMRGRTATHSDEPCGLSLFYFDMKDLSEARMLTEYDEKGKIFTEIVSKIAMYATIQTTTHRMRGRIHVRRDERIKDELDRDEGFLAFTEVTVFNADGSVMSEAPFVAVQRDHIVWVIPEPNTGEQRQS